MSDRKQKLIRKCWTPAEDLLLKELTGKGYTIAEIGEMMGRSKYSIGSRRNTLNIHVNHYVAKPEKKKPVDNLSRLAREAREHGMQYGRYVAMLHEREHRRRFV